MAYAEWKQRQQHPQSAVEAWYKVLKYKFGKGELHTTSLTGCAKHIMITAKDYDIRARAAELDFRTKRHPIVLKTPLDGKPALSGVGVDHRRIQNRRKEG
jgi:hypothetical protein